MTKPRTPGWFEDERNRLGPQENDEGYGLREAVSFLALSSVSGVGYWKLYKIAQSGLSFNSILKSDSFEEFESYLAIKIKTADRADWEEFQKNTWMAGNAEMRKLIANKILLIFSWQSQFPARLVEIEDPAYWLFVQGDIDNLHKSSVAIIGTRKPDADGLFLTKYLTALLAPMDVVTVSGLADGIDQCAHVNSVKFSLPTVGILGTGIYTDFPKGAKEVRASMLEHGGTVISEYPINESYNGKNFVRRNRLQVALSSIVFPIQWKSKSGTARAVDFAIKYNRPIVQLRLPNSQVNSKVIDLLENGETRTYICESPSSTSDIVGLLEVYLFGVYTESYENVDEHGSGKNLRESRSLID